MDAANRDGMVVPSYARAGKTLETIFYGECKICHQCISRKMQKE